MLIEARMKVSALRSFVDVRTSRKKRGVITMPMANMAFTRPAPSEATTAMASTRPGTLRIVLLMKESRESTAPPT